MLVGSAPDLEVVGQAADGAQALDLTLEHRPDVVLMDIRMPGTDGLAATTAITAHPALADTRVLILTTFEMDEYVFRALRAGAAGFLGKSVTAAVLLDAIRTVSAGESLLSPAALRGLIERFLREPDAQPLQPPVELARLTDREREVLVLVAGGLSNDEIAQRLVLSPLTAKTHVNRAMIKLGARDRAQLVVIAYQSGLVRAG